MKQNAAPGPDRPIAVCVSCIDCYVGTALMVLLDRFALKVGALRAACRCDDMYRHMGCSIEAYPSAFTSCMWCHAWPKWPNTAVVFYCICTQASVFWPLCRQNHTFMLLFLHPTSQILSYSPSWWLSHHSLSDFVQLVLLAAGNCRSRLSLSIGSLAATIRYFTLIDCCQR